MTNEIVETDVVVIGAGPGGYIAAIKAAQLGKSVVVIEKQEVGGICLHSGCIPSKALINVAHKYDEIKQFDSLGIELNGNVSLNFEKTQKWKQEIINQLLNGIKKLFKINKIKLIYGEAKFVSNHEIQVKSDVEHLNIMFEQCIIATGSKPIELPLIPFGRRILSSTDVLNLKNIPARMVVIGGGYIGIELSQVFAKLGCKITIIEGTKSILPGFDARLISLVKRNIKKSNINVYTNAMAKQVEEHENRVTVTYMENDVEQSIDADYILVTVGRKPNTSNLGLDNTSVKLNHKGYLEVDNQCRSSVPNIFAIGDIIEGPALAHKASYEAKVVAEVIAGRNIFNEYKVIPLVVFSDPEIAVVGLSEEQAREQGKDVLVGKISYGANGRALTLVAPEGSVTLIADKQTKQVIGAQIVGIEASNLIAECALAIQIGATLEELSLTIHAHPTISEIIPEAAEMALRSIY